VPDAAARGRTPGDRLLEPANAALAAGVLAFLYLPVAVLAVYSFSGSRFATKWGGFSLRWYESLAASADVRRAAANSLVVAAWVALLATVLGTALALGLHRRARRASTARHDAAVMAPILVPDVVQGIALLLAFVLLFDVVERLTGSRPTLGRTTIVLAHTSFATSYVTLLVRARLAGTSAALEEAAADLGATPAQTFLRVTLPLLLPAVVGGALLAFTLSLDEYVITFFTSGSGSDTLPLHVAASARRGITPQVNALSAVMVAVSLALAVAAMALQRRRT
jgi:spermidine/putrescine transport system permease protein